MAFQTPFCTCELAHENPYHSHPAEVCLRGRGRRRNVQSRQRLLALLLEQLFRVPARLLRLCTGLRFVQPVRGRRMWNSIVLWPVRRLFAVRVLSLQLQSLRVFSLQRRLWDLQQRMQRELCSGLQSRSGSQCEQR